MLKLPSGVTPFITYGRKNIKILYCDNHLLALEKPPRLLTQADSTGDPTLLELASKFIKKAYEKPGNVFMGLPHRLDRPCSGIVLLCRTSKALLRINAQFSARTAAKQYLVVVHGVPHPRQGVTNRPVPLAAKFQPTGNNKITTEMEPLEYKVVRTFSQMNAAELKCSSSSGKKHQIRRQLAGMGYPIVGDFLYGGSVRSYIEGAIMLHASLLSFDHPTTKERITIRGSPSPEWQNFLQ